MLTTNFLPFLNHLLTEVSDNYDASLVVNRLLPIFPTLEAKSPSPFEKKVFKFLYDFVDKYSTAPSRMTFYTSMAACAQGSDGADLQDFSSKIQSGLIPRFSVGDWNHLLDQYEAGRDIWILEDTTRTALEIYSTPIKINGKQLHGFKDALDFAQRGVAVLGSSINNVEVINLEENGEQAFAQYLADKDNDATCAKILSGLADIDKQFKGFRKGELISIMGYPGDGKTSLCVNMAYNAFLQGYNVVYITLEMPAEAMKCRFHVRHSANYNLFKREPISLQQYMDFELSDDDAKFMFRSVVPDFTRNTDPEYGLRGSIRVIEPGEEGLSFPLLKAELLKLHAEHPIDIFFLDYPNLMDVASERGQDFDKSMSRLYVKLKTLCRTFNDGDRLIGVIPTQVNRSGRESAEKANGAYTLRAIQEYSEIANSSDFVLGIFRDNALVQTNECIISNAKARRAGVILQFIATFMGDSCRISDKTEEAAPEDLAEVLKNKQSKPAPPTSFDIGSEE